MKIVHTEFELAEIQGRGVFVPTMGALHAGHGELVRRAAATAKERGLAGVVVSVFVNPTQFNEQADFARYPRTLEADASLAAAYGAAWVFAPEVSTMYPGGLAVGVPELPRSATEPKLEDMQRPGHFAGVCQVVRRLFELVRPRVAVFGEKDWQQLAVVREMTAMLKMPVEVVEIETVRETDGLAMSSRNVFLTAEDRVRSVAIARALRAASHERDRVAAEVGMVRMLGDAGIEPEYAVIRDATTLIAPSASGRACRALIAARLGKVRLIDNAPWSPNSAA